jgi:hypothetical protein
MPNFRAFDCTHRGHATPAGAPRARHFAVLPAISRVARFLVIGLPKQRAWLDDPSMIVSFAPRFAGARPRDRGMVRRLRSPPCSPAEQRPDSQRRARA